jgi:hypothetical protein
MWIKGNGKLVRYANKESNFKKEDLLYFSAMDTRCFGTFATRISNTPSRFLHWYNLVLLPVQDLTAIMPKNVIISASSELNYRL